MAIEKPDYDVLEDADNGIEVRRYPPMIVAETTVEGERDDAANAAFQILADYIFAKNRDGDKISMTAPVMQSPSEKIAMTAPVMQQPAGDGRWTVAFMMPSKYTLETLPPPNDDRITIRQAEPRRAVAIRYGGRWTRSNIDKHAKELDAFVEARGLQTVGDPVMAFYDPPFTPWFLRRNEVIRYLAD